MDTLLQDLRYAIRWLTRHPGFTFVTLLALAVGIGANSTIVSIANALLLRPLPVRQPGTLVRIFSGRDSATLWSRVAIFVAILFALSAIVLCIACLNVANLLLARSSARLSELGIRLAMGASRGRIVRQLLTESVLLALGGGALGVALAYWITLAIGRWTPPAPVAIELRVSPDWSVLVATFGIVLAAALFFGLTPAWSAARRAVMISLRHSATRGSGSGVSRRRPYLLVAQVSLSLVLLVMAGLLVRSLGHAQRIDVGFDREGVLIATMDLEVGNYTPERGLALYRTLVEQVGALPRVRRVSMLDAVPLTGAVRGTTILKEGDIPPPRDQSERLPTVNRNAVGPGYFETMGIRRLVGRDFTSRDTATAPQVAIVNETLARRLWPGQPALGKRLRRYDSRNPDTPLIEIVGMVKDSKYVSVGEEPRSFMYRPLEQDYTPRGTVVARVDGDPVALVPEVREVLKRLDPNLPLVEARSLTDATSISLLPLRMAAVFLVVLGLLVLALAAIGLYGVLSFLVQLRTKEIGIRMALGADRAQVIRTVMSDALFWMAWGAGAGLILAFLLAPFVASLLYGVPPRDAITFAIVTLLLVGVGAAASLIPALRASRMDPLAALRID